MLHVGIDLGGKESQICVRDANGEIVVEQKHFTRKIPQLVATWPAPCRVVMETCAEAFRIADAVRAAGHEIRVVPASLVRQIGVGARGVKNDRRDAQQLSKASWQTDVPSVHIPSHRSRELKAICGSRDILIRSRTMVVNNVRGWVRGQLWKLRGCTAVTLPGQLRAHAESLATALPEHVERNLVLLEALNAQVKAADKQLTALADADPICRLLMEVPGVGPITAVRFVATVDDPSRFPTTHRLQSYLGLTPGENSSSERQLKTGITKAGPDALRRCLVNAAWSLLRSKQTPPMVEWAVRIQQRRNTYVGVVALARKLAGVLFAIWRDGSHYAPSRTARLAA